MWGCGNHPYEFNPGRCLRRGSATDCMGTGKHYSTMVLVAEMVDPHCAHISRGWGRPTSSLHHLVGKHAPPLDGRAVLCAVAELLV